MSDLLQQSSKLARFQTVLLTLLALLALVLAAIGIYGVLAYSVSQRTSEFGLRMALGATRANVMMLVMRQGAVLVLSGIVLGSALALAFVKILRSMLFEVSPYDPLAFASVLALLSTVALLACGVPAWRSVQVDPIVALRHE